MRCIFNDPEFIGSSEWLADVSAHGHTVSYALSDPEPVCGCSDSCPNCDCHPDPKPISNAIAGPTLI